jgi:hypothetical protein
LAEKFGLAGTLALPGSNPLTQAEMQAVAYRLDEVITALEGGYP